MRGHRGFWGAVLVVVLVFVTGSVTDTRAGEVSEASIATRWSSYFQFWWNVSEQVNTTLQQPLSRDEAASVASGFNLRRARLAVDFSGERIQGRVSLRLEGSPPGLLDAYGSLPLAGRELELYIGQMKIPATYETATSSAALDFLSRTRFSGEVINLSLSKSPSLLSPRFNGVNTYLRDLGVALKGRIDRGEYHLMISNGLGANRFIGGPENKQELYTNSFGAYCYAARLGWEFLSLEGKSGVSPRGRVIDALAIGGHILWNNHPNVILDDERTVLDIKRQSWSADLRTRLGNWVDLTAMLGAGRVLDDLDNDGRDDYRYSGWELKAVAPVLRRYIIVGVRYDSFIDESFENGFEISRNSILLGLTYLPQPLMRIQLEWKYKMFPDRPENADHENLILLAAQIDFN